MLKYKLLLMLWGVGILSIANSQITITNQGFPSVGDTLFFAIDTNPTDIMVTPPGGNQTWDYTSLNATYTWQQIFKTPAEGSASGAFPDAELYYQSNNIENYLNKTGQSLQLLGYFGTDPAGLGINLVSRYNPPITEQRAPMNFFDINALSSGLLVPFSIDVLPAAIRNQLPVVPDSLRIRIAINRLDVVDGWGNLAIPGGSYQVLREKRTAYRETRLDAKVQPLGWLDITDIAIQSLGLNTLGVDTTTTYNFFSNDAKEPIAVLTMDKENSHVISVQYKFNNITTATTNVNTALPDFNAYPNPASGKVYFNVNNIQPGNYNLKMYNALGMEVSQKTYKIVGKRFNGEIDVSKLAPGIYSYQLFDHRGVALATKQLAVVRP